MCVVLKRLNAPAMTSSFFVSRTGIDPALWNFGHRHAAGTIRREKAELQFVLVQDWRLLPAHAYVTRWNLFVKNGQ
jgi:hypothetical protein